MLGFTISFLFICIALKPLWSSPNKVFFQMTANKVTVFMKKTTFSFHYNIKIKYTPIKTIVTSDTQLKSTTCCCHHALYATIFPPGFIPQFFPINL